MLDPSEVGTVFIPCTLAPAEQQVLIQSFYECYFNTDQAAKDFGEEFFYVVGNIVTGYVPVKLEYLTDFEAIVCAASPGYKAAYELKKEEGHGQNHDERSDG